MNSLQRIATLYLVFQLSFGQEPSDSAPRDVEKRYCISMNVGSDGASHDFHCTHDDISLTYDQEGRPFKKKNRRINTAITQRIDGSVDEQNAIKEVMRKQEEYLLREVYALPEYEPVRYRCNNKNELCSFWAAVGECESNRVFMLPNCAAACRFCLLSVTYIG